MSSPSWERGSASSIVLRKSKGGIRRRVGLTKTPDGLTSYQKGDKLGILEMGVRVTAIPRHQHSGSECGWDCRRRGIPCGALTTPWTCCNEVGLGHQPRFWDSEMCQEMAHFDEMLWCCFLCLTNEVSHRDSPSLRKGKLGDEERASSADKVGAHD